MSWLSDRVPDADAVLALEPGELAAILLEHWISGYAVEVNWRDLAAFYWEGYPEAHWEDLKKALMEAWAYLIAEGLLAPKPDSARETWFLTRRARTVTSRTDWDCYRHSRLLPIGILHSALHQTVVPLFLRGAYDTAVFEAFKSVEVAVRTAGGFPPTTLGVDLMRKAFGAACPLADPNGVKAEVEALANLFAGSIGYSKNPLSHRNVNLSCTEAVEMIVLASHLLKLVDARNSP